MAAIFSGNSLWQLVSQSDFMSKFVLLLLLGMSIVGWALFFYKVLMVRKKIDQCNQVAFASKNVSNIQDLVSLATVHAHMISGLLLSRNLGSLKRLLSTDKEPKDSLTEQDWQLLQQTVYQQVDDLIGHEERGLPFLSFSAASGPLLGLFGTVWGLVHSFIRISQKGSADIATVAPGIAEALITTLAGLMVAIPALALYYYVMLQTRYLEQRLQNIADSFLWTVHKTFASYTKPLKGSFMTTGIQQQPSEQ